MFILLVLLVFAYLFLIVLNYKGFTDNRVTAFLTVITAILSTIMLCSSNTADLDWAETELDMSGYRSIYEKYDALEYQDFNMYYLFYSSMHLGQSLGIPFRLWWASMSVLAMLVILIACKVHKYSFNLFLATFMAYYEMIFYSGFKFFYGFCFLLLAYGFLFTENRKRPFLFILFTCVAGGFHVMYYLFLILLIKPKKKPKAFVSILVIMTILLTVLMRVSNSAVSFLAPIFESFDNEHINSYTTETVHSGFYIAIFIHLIVVFIAYRIRMFNVAGQAHIDDTNTLYYSVLLSLLFCPLYAISLTFMRFITAFSLVVITSSSSILSDSYRSRVLCTRMSLLVVFAYFFIRILIGGFFQTSVVPYFDVL